MKKVWIVITSINQPTVAVREFAALAEARRVGVVVVGDTKSPPDWRLEGVDFLSIDDQSRQFPEVAKAVPTRSYARKNLGYLFAMQRGAEVIIDTDDDNRPLPGFAEGLSPEVTGRSLGGADWVNVYAHFTDRLIWPRGLPLNRIHERGQLADPAPLRCPVQQFLADEDPDVDAIYRLLYREPVVFAAGAQPLVLEPGTYCPFNSQNTVFFREAFPLLYLPSHVSFRMTDIWRSFVAQRVLWATGGRLSFHRATVFQERNAHDLMRDFRDEVDGYLRNAEIGQALSALSLPSGGEPGAAVAACYAALRDIGVVQDEELRVLEAWSAAAQRVVAR